jgi:hypothetical protein
MYDAFETVKTLKILEDHYFRLMASMRMLEWKFHEFHYGIPKSKFLFMG